jgi:hypothetical protein
LSGIGWLILENFLFKISVYMYYYSFAINFPWKRLCPFLSTKLNPLPLESPPSKNFLCHNWSESALWFDLKKFDGLTTYNGQLENLRIKSNQNIARNHCKINQALLQCLPKCHKVSLHKAIQHEFMYLEQYPTQLFNLWVIYIIYTRLEKGNKITTNDINW